MGSEKLTAGQLAEARKDAERLPILMVPSETLLVLIDAYEATQRPIEPDPDPSVQRKAVVGLLYADEPDEQRAGGVTGEQADESLRKLFDAGRRTRKDAFSTTWFLDVQHLIATLRTALAAAERERDAYSRACDRVAAERNRAEEERDGYKIGFDNARAEAEQQRRVAENAREAYDIAIRERDEARRTALAANVVGPWAWMPGGRMANDLGSMSDDMAITMTAGTLRGLLVTERCEAEDELLAVTARATLLQSELDHARGKIEGMRAAAARAETAEGLLRDIERHASAIIQEGGDAMTLNYDAAKALAGKLDTARSRLQSLKGGSDAEG